MCDMCDIYVWNMWYIHVMCVCVEYMWCVLWKIVVCMCSVYVVYMWYVCVVCDSANLFVLQSRDAYGLLFLGRLQKGTTFQAVVSFWKRLVAEP